MPARPRFGGSPSVEQEGGSAVFPNLECGDVFSSVYAGAYEGEPPGYDQGRRQNEVHLNAVALGAGAKLPGISRSR